MTTDQLATTLPSWPGRIRLMRRSAEVLALLAVLTDAAAAIYQGAPSGVYLALAVSAAGIWASRTRPLLGLVLVQAAVAAIAVTGWEPAAVWSVVVFILFSATLAGVRALPAGLVVGCTQYLLVAGALHVWPLSPSALVAALASVAAAGVGGAVRAQWRYLTVVQQQAADTVRARRIETELEVDRERLRIARDLHDLIGHEVAALNVHLGVAEVSLPESAERSRAALGRARSSVQAILAEAQDILRLLRRGVGTSDAGDHGPVPTPGPDQFAALIESFRAMGLDLRCDYDPAELALLHPATGLAAYRTIEEALTNAHRHGAGPTRLRIRRDGDHLLIEVANPVSDGAVASAGTGLGLIGIRERVESLGGAVTVDRGDGMFLVLATLPWRGSMAG